MVALHFSITPPANSRCIIYHAFAIVRFYRLLPLKLSMHLIGLQTGVISSDSMVIPWDGIKRPFRNGTKTLPCMKPSAYQPCRIFRKWRGALGKTPCSTGSTPLSYGTKKIKTRVDTFWLDHSLKISPDEQLGLVKRLYFNQLPFFKVNQETVKRAMIFEQNTAYTLAYKTGWGAWTRYIKNTLAGWSAGSRRTKQPRFFVLNLESKDPNFDMPTMRMRILKSILQQLGFMQGSNKPA